MPGFRMSGRCHAAHAAVDPGLPRPRRPRVRRGATPLTVARTTCVTATYRPNGTGEVYQVAVQVSEVSVSALDEVCSRVVQTMAEMVHDAIDAYTPKP